MRLFLCEKPSQAKDLAPHVGARTRADGYFAGDGVMVTYAFGHLMEQAKPEAYQAELKQWKLSLLPVVPPPGGWKLEVKADGKQQFNRIAKLLKQAREVVIATDSDREGEVIAREIMEVTGYRGPVQRLWTSATDPASLKKALGKLLPGQKTLPMYFSGLGRARADWLGGMNVTMALTTGFGAGGKGGVLHFGRVQTPVLALVVRRERTIRNFVPKTHFVLATTFDLGNKPVPMRWFAHPDLVDKDGHVIDRAKLEAIATKVRHRMGAIVKHETTPAPEQVPLPYYLGGLQKEASRLFGIKPAAVLDACQALYEKHKATTYPRTDCEYLPTSMFGEAREIAAALVQIDPSMAPYVDRMDFASKSRAWNDGQVAKSSHHAIIPTGYASVDMAAMTSNERRVYDLIRRRYIAQFLGAAGFNKTVIEIECEGERFGASGRVMTSPGWLLAYPEKMKAATAPADETEEPAEGLSALPDIGKQTTSKNLDAAVTTAKTKPPRRYTEASMLTAMESIDKEIEDPRLQKIMRSKEKAGIGTDATRAGILENLFDRDYLALEKKEIVPTDKGMALIELLERIAPQLADPVLTAEWEDRLKQVEDGQLSLEQFDAEMARWVSSLIETIKREASKPDAMRIGGSGGAAPSVACPDCKRPMRRIKGPKRFFWGCTGYQEGCKTTLPDVDGAPGQRARAEASATQQAVAGATYYCPDCHKPLQRRNGPNGPFWGCTGYPECRRTQPDEKGRPGVRPDQVTGKARFVDNHHATHDKAVPAGNIGDRCPTCGSGLLIKKTMKDSGKPFIGCNRFPECRYFKWPN